MTPVAQTVRVRHYKRRAAADAIEHWLPQVVKVDIKDERRKLKLAALRAP